MKKQLFAGLLLAATALGASAQNDGVLTLYGLQDYSVYALSPSGKWAVGYFQNGSGTYYPFRWNLETDETELLCRNNDQGWAMDVADNGTVVGSYTDYSLSSNGAGVSTGGYYDATGWHALEGIDGSTTSEAQAISADGQWVGGYCYSSAGMMPVVWRNGKLYRQLGDGNQGCVYGISDDGTKAAGWTYTNGSGGMRVSVVWDVETGNPTYLCADDEAWHTRSARSFTPDGRYVLDDQGYYDMQTGEHTVLGYYSSAQVFSCLYTSIDNQLRVYGYEQTMMGDAYGVVYHDGTATKLDDYLDSLGVDLSHIPYGNLLTINSVSADGKTLAIGTNDTSMYERPLIVRLDENVTSRQPAALRASQLNGLQASRLTWKAPINNPTNLTGYNVYRDGAKLNAQPISDTHYIDTQLAYGNYTYTVTALYAAGESTQSDAASVTIGEPTVSAPRALFARQRGYNGASFTWNAPATNLVEKRYYNDNSTIIGFGGGSYSFEFGIKHDREEMAAYAGHKLTKVSFIPREAQISWELRIYNGANLVYSQPITQTLNYGEVNVVELTTPIDVATFTDDVICAISVVVPSTSNSSNVVGMVETECTPGYSDLVHLGTESSFYSLSEQSRAGGYVFDVAFAMSMILSPANAPADIDNVSRYNVYADGQLLGSTSAASYINGSMADGEHTCEVEAVYADGRISPRAATTFAIAADRNALPAVENVRMSIDGTTVTFAWDTPVDNDKQAVSYSGDNFSQTIAGPESSNYGYVARTIYSGNKLRGLDGYQIRQLRFFPTGDAMFTFTLYENSNEVAYVEVDDYTLNTWNVVDLETPITLNANAEYTLDLDCFDGDPDQGPLGCDDQPIMAGVSNLYSVDSGTSFSQTSGSETGNWMIGMVVTSPTSQPLANDGYRVVVDGRQMMTSNSTATTFVHDFGSDADATAQHRVLVNTYYPGVSGYVRGTTIFFTLEGVLAGIDDAIVADLRVYPNPAVNYVAVEGATVDALEAYNMGGKLVAQANGNRLDVSRLAGGLYVLKIKANGDTHTVKLIVKR